MNEATELRGMIRLRVEFDPGTVERKFLALPKRMQRSIRRKAMKAGLAIIRGSLRRQLAAHRTSYVRPHLADSVATVSRNIRKSRRRGTYLLWGAVGIRFGKAPLRMLGKLQGAAAAGGGTTAVQSYTRSVGGRAIAVQGHSRRARARTTPYPADLPGWRWHFIERGTKRFIGRRYLERITLAARGMVAAKVRQTANELIRKA